jgi:nucleotide-binding universal stress UspA family protein
VSAPAAPIRRILVALDASAPSRLALEAAVALASRLGAELEGLFVEEGDLLRVAALPSSRHLALAGGAPLDLGAIASGLEAVAERARSALAAAATSRRVRWSFRVARGRADVEVLQASEAADLLVLGRAGQGMPGRPGPGRTAVAAATSGQKPVLVLGPAARARPASREGGPLLVAWDGSESAAVALALSVQLAAGGPEAPRLLVAAPSREEAARLAAEAAVRCGRRLAWRWTGGEAAADLLRSVPLEGVLVVGAASRVAGGVEGRARLLRECPCPVLMVR